jgi:hypothetical protein
MVLTQPYELKTLNKNQLNYERDVPTATILPLSMMAILSARSTKFS